MQLTYRGIRYNPQSLAAQNIQLDCIRKYRLSEKCDANKIAWLQPINYYTYRGVSYTKRPLVNAKTQLLK